MPPVFGRHFQSSHPYDAALEDWSRSSNPGERALARNLMHDHRVSQKRADFFDTLVAKPVTAATLQTAITDYFNHHIRLSFAPDFVQSETNQVNILNGQHPLHRIFAKDLVRVLDLSGMEPVYIWGRDHGLSAFKDFPRTSDQVAAWVDDELNARQRRPIPAVREFVQDLLEAMNGQRQGRAFQPVWATSWGKFSRIAKGHPNRWLEALGMHKETQPRWLIVLRYSLSNDMPLVWPTQLDAGWGGIGHFPAPPEALPDCGGHPMDLRLPSRARTLRLEFIHQQIDHSIEHWIRAGSKCSSTDAPTSADLAKQRICHHRLLIRKYGNSVKTWMPLE